MRALLIVSQVFSAALDSPQSARFGGTSGSTDRLCCDILERMTVDSEDR